MVQFLFQIGQLNHGFKQSQFSWKSEKLCK